MLNLSLEALNTEKEESISSMEELYQTIIASNEQYIDILNASYALDEMFKSLENLETIENHLQIYGASEALIDLIGEQFIASFEAVEEEKPNIFIRAYRAVVEFIRKIIDWFKGPAIKSTKAKAEKIKKFLKSKGEDNNLNNNDNDKSKDSVEVFSRSTELSKAYLKSYPIYVQVPFPTEEDKDFNSVENLLQYISKVAQQFKKCKDTLIKSVDIIGKYTKESSISDPKRIDTLDDPFIRDIGFWVSTKYTLKKMMIDLSDGNKIANKIDETVQIIEGYAPLLHKLENYAEQFVAMGSKKMTDIRWRRQFSLDHRFNKETGIDNPDSYRKWRQDHVRCVQTSRNFTYGNFGQKLKYIATIASNNIKFFDKFISGVYKGLSTYRARKTVLDKK